MLCLWQQRTTHLPGSDSGSNSWARAYWPMSQGSLQSCFCSSASLCSPSGHPGQFLALQQRHLGKNLRRHSRPDHLGHERQHIVVQSDYAQPAAAPLSPHPLEQGPGINIARPDRRRLPFAFGALLAGSPAGLAIAHPFRIAVPLPDLDQFPVSALWVSAITRPNSCWDSCRVRPASFFWSSSPG